jgi:hypothetical protein
VRHPGAVAEDVPAAVAVPGEHGGVEMEVAIEFAKASPNPDPARLTEDVYA